ncbi:hypothetical protein [Spongiactinospora gelatinilytica]|nr:hypothetical protein [Spongiactinospora gelatinilytica]
MADARYLSWFEQWFGDADTLTWCSAASSRDVLAAYGMAAVPLETGRMTELMEWRLLAGHVGDRMLVVQTNGCPGDEVLDQLARFGPALSVQWSDTAPPAVTYLEEGQVVAAFDPFELEFNSVPDVGAVERWLAGTPAGRQMWEEDWALAVLFTAEALCGEAVDDVWVRRSHTVVR